MASWRIRFHDKWPHLASLYASTHNLDEEGKHPDPIMGQDNIFDPSEPYGAYRYYIQPTARSEFSMEEPTYVNRPVYKDEESRSSDYTSRASSSRGSTCRVLLCVFLTLSFIGVVVAAITLAVLLSKTPRSSRATQGPIEEYESIASLLGQKFNDNLYDKNSDEFKKLEKDVCTAISQIFTDDGSPVQYEYDECMVIEFMQENTVLVTFRIRLKPKSSEGYKSENRIRQRLEEQFSSKVKQHGPWQSVKIDPDFARRFVKIEAPIIQTPTTSSATTEATQETTTTSRPDIDKSTQKPAMNETTTESTPGPTDSMAVTEQTASTNVTEIEMFTEAITESIHNTTDSFDFTVTLQTTKAITQDFTSVTTLSITPIVSKDSITTVSQVTPIPDSTETLPRDFTTADTKINITTIADVFTNITVSVTAETTDVAPDTRPASGVVTDVTTIDPFYMFDNITLPDNGTSSTDSFEETTKDQTGNVTVVDPLTKPVSTQAVDQTTSVTTDVRMTTVDGITTVDVSQHGTDVSQTSVPITKATTETVQVTTEGVSTSEMTATMVQTTYGIVSHNETTEVTNISDITTVADQTSTETHQDITTQYIPRHTSPLPSDHTQSVDITSTMAASTVALVSTVNHTAVNTEVTPVDPITPDVTIHSSLESTDSPTSTDVMETTTSGNVTDSSQVFVDVTTSESSTDVTTAAQQHSDLTTGTVSLTTVNVAISTMPGQTTVDTISIVDTVGPETTESVANVTDIDSTAVTTSVVTASGGAINTTLDSATSVTGVDNTTFYNESMASETTTESFIDANLTSTESVTDFTVEAVTEDVSTSRETLSTMQYYSNATTQVASTESMTETTTVNLTTDIQADTSTVQTSVPSTVPTDTVTSMNATTFEVTTDMSTMVTMQDTTATQETVTSASPDGTTFSNETQTQVPVTVKDMTTLLTDITTDGFSTDSITLDGVTVNESTTTESLSDNITSTGGIEPSSVPFRQDSLITTPEYVNASITTVVDGAIVQSTLRTDQVTMESVTTPGIKLTTDSVVIITEGVSTFTDSMAVTETDITTQGSNETFTETVTSVFDTTTLNDSQIISDITNVTEETLGNLTTKPTEVTSSAFTLDPSMTIDTSKQTMDGFVTSTQGQTTTSSVNVTFIDTVTSTYKPTQTEVLTSATGSTEAPANVTDMYDLLLNVTDDLGNYTDLINNFTDSTMLLNATDTQSNETGLRELLVINVTQSAPIRASTVAVTQASPTGDVASTIGLTQASPDVASTIAVTQASPDVNSTIAVTPASPGLASTIAVTQASPDVNSTLAVTQASPDVNSTIAVTHASPDVNSTIYVTQASPDVNSTLAVTQTSPDVNSTIAVTQTSPDVNSTIAVTQQTPIDVTTLNETLTGFLNSTEFPLYENVSDIDFSLLNMTDLSFLNETSTPGEFTANTHGTAAVVDTNIVNNQFNSSFTGGLNANGTISALVGAVTNNLPSTRDNTTSTSNSATSIP